MRTPLTLVTGPLGSGKTTLLLAILDRADRRLAVVMNEFGELAIDRQVIAGKHVQVAELDGGCVCCSLIGEFEAAVDEIIAAADPDHIVVETTGLAEPEALVFDIQEQLPQVRLDGVVTVADADALLRFPRLGHTSQMQIAAADLILLNKADLASERQLADLKARLAGLNPIAPVIATCRCRVDPELLFGLGRARPAAAPRHVHQPQFQSFVWRSGRRLERGAFEAFAAGLGGAVYRAKGFVVFAGESCLFNFVAGRWSLEPFAAQATGLVFIGEAAAAHRQDILARLRACERREE
ncbi:MAG: GTP-binding protein [Pseudomonadota bacterium]|nr:GTP-binding protein [Pseudomonadota bacterium]